MSKKVSVFMGQAVVVVVAACIMVVAVVSAIALSRWLLL
jgi:hypothetical protein